MSRATILNARVLMILAGLSVCAPLYAQTFVRVTPATIATHRTDTWGASWVDYDGDGDQDLFLSNIFSNNITPNNLLYRNDGGGSFARASAGALTNAWSAGNCWADYDNDGDLDVFVSNATSRNRYYVNNGDGTFTSIDGPFADDVNVSWPGPAADYDGDGDLDLFVGNVGAQPPSVNFLYRNDLDNDNHWLKIKVVGVESNRAGIGAKVKATAVIGGQDVTQFREISSQNTFNGQHSLEVHVGLGDAAVVEEVRIEWPSSTVDVLNDVAADQTITVEEGTTPVPVEEAPVLLGHFALEQNYPNPFYRATTIRYSLPRTAFVRLKVIDLLGREVTTLVERHQPSGWHEVVFRAGDVPAGVYLYRLQAGDAFLHARAFLLLQ